MAKRYDSKSNGQLNWKLILNNYGIKVFYNSKSDEYQILSSGVIETKLQPEDLNDLQLKELEKAVSKNKKNDSGI